MRTKSPGYLRIDPPARRMPFGIEKEIDDSGRWGKVMVFVIIGLIAVYAWLRH